MTERTTRTTITFYKVAVIQGLTEPLPAGDYVVETDEEQMHGLSFLAYRRVRTSIIVPARFGCATARQLVEIDPVDLATALARDAGDPAQAEGALHK